MSSILSAIYRRAYEPASGSRNPASPINQQLRSVDRLETAFRNKLSPELMSEYELLKKEQDNLSFLECEADFSEGFCLGVQLMVAALGDKKEA